MTQPILQVSNLTKRFGGVAAVSGVSLDVYPKETLAIIGPNGAGKTTFYNMLSGRMIPTEGSIVFEGRDITGLPPHRISRLGVSRSFQINNIFDEMTVRENVEVAVTAYRHEGRRWLNVASRNRGVQEEADELLNRLAMTSLSEKRAGVISYGDKRLVEIAVVLATRPHLVLLDEPTAGMTPDETHRVTSLVKSLAATGDYTFLITEHDMSVVFDVADRILVMHRGQTLVLGEPQEVRAHPEVRRAYLGDTEEEIAS
ncbi:ABC transporter ATP-binding protein [Pollutimonas thiosulfatoxidans]|uniref:ABC transporter ATP-binding protein n=1 Tax=Pollutimonas thiosulfatoxidans TaxID=2028345 RepID=A0A410G8U0_9BURK|nr:ABC transporter ATP-binding protein [Pollutimonas thiosulfatoxidans]MBF6618424.1 ABC transporter ATP-binding protein [Candidimonas sp.]NYT43540.1 ABC transporter ATP-binding protein [Alcaligenaceae bacterium]QAA92710.1 ABC transporter ATP-binding protein [Pollutimonas thiosulfatoxidans]